jgi:hypothetical protein
MREIKTGESVEAMSMTSKSKMPTSVSLAHDIETCYFDIIREAQGPKWKLKHTQV